MQEVNVKNQAVPMRTITLKEGKEVCRVALWRENATKDISTGDNLVITNVVVNQYQNEVSLSSTHRTTIEKSPLQKIELCNIGVIAYSIEGESMILLLDNDEMEEVKVDLSVYSTAMDITIEDIKDNIERIITDEKKMKIDVVGDKIVNLNLL